jgi:hypothetical protein
MIHEADLNELIKRWAFCLADLSVLS